MILLHGTTLDRARLILRDGPDPRYREPGGRPGEDGFSMALETGPFPFGRPEDYARGKADQFPDEGGAAIVRVDVPDEIVRLATSPWFPLEQGLVQFDPGAGWEVLIAAWPGLAKEIRSLP